MKQSAFSTRLKAHWRKWKKFLSKCLNSWKEPKIPNSIAATASGKCKLNRETLLTSLEFSAKKMRSRKTRKHFPEYCYVLVITSIRIGRFHFPVRAISKVKFYTLTTIKIRFDSKTRKLLWSGSEILVAISPSSWAKSLKRLVADFLAHAGLWTTNN